MARRKTRKQQEAEEFRGAVFWLLPMTDAEWTYWEEKWLNDQARRPADYNYSPEQRKILNQLKALARKFKYYSGYSVQELARLAVRYVADYPQHEDLLNGIISVGITELRVRQIDTLAWIVRTKIQWIPIDEEIEAILNALKRDEAPEVDEFTAYSKVA